MPPPWLSTVRSLLKALTQAEKRKNLAEPNKSQLELLNVTIRHTYDINGLENIGIITEFLDGHNQQREIRFMISTFGLRSSTFACSQYVASRLFDWISHGMKRLIVDEVKIRKRPRVGIPNETYSNGVQPEMTAMFRNTTESKCLYLSIVARKERKSDEALITSAELYTLFALAARYVLRQPLADSIEVRMLVVYSQWVQVVTAKMARSYYTSIIEGWDNIAGEMEVHQTPWFNFATLLGQHCIFLAAFESIRLQSPDVDTQPVLNQTAPRGQGWESPKRKRPVAEECGNQKRKMEHKPGDAEDILPTPLKDFPATSTAC